LPETDFVSYLWANNKKLGQKGPHRTKTKTKEVAKEGGYFTSTWGKPREKKTANKNAQHLSPSGLGINLPAFGPRRKGVSTAKGRTASKENYARSVKSRNGNQKVWSRKKGKGRNWGKMGK